MKNIPELDKIFDITPVDETELPTTLPAVSDSESRQMDQEDDYQLARNTLRNLIHKSEDTLDQMIDLAKNSEHPRTYEVAGQFMKTMSDVSKDLLLLQKQVKDLKKDDPIKIGTQNNMVFNGSTADLFKMLKNGPSEDNIIEQ